jgi:hypothetical protein
MTRKNVLKGLTLKERRIQIKKEIEAKYAAIDTDDLPF